MSPFVARVLFVCVSSLLLAWAAWAGWQSKAESLRSEGRAEAQAECRAAALEAQRQQDQRESGLRAKAATAAQVLEAQRAAQQAQFQALNAELTNASKNLRNCRLSPAAVRLLNAAGSASPTAAPAAN